MKLSLSRNYRSSLYHATDYTAAMMIAREGHFAMSFNHGQHEQGTAKWPFYLSTTRTLDNPYKEAVVFELDPSKFPRGTKVAPFNYWSGDGARYVEEHNRYKNEFEERVLGTKGTLPLSCVVVVHITLVPILDTESVAIKQKHSRALMALVQALRGKYEIRLYDSIADLRRRRVSRAKLVDIARWLKGTGNVFAKPVKDGARDYVEKAYRRDMEILRIIDNPELLAEQMSKSYKFREQVMSMRPTGNLMDSPLHNAINNLKGGGARERQIGARLLSTMRAKKLYTPKDLDRAIVNAINIMEDKKTIAHVTSRLEFGLKLRDMVKSGEKTADEVRDWQWHVIEFLRSLRLTVMRENDGDTDAADERELRIARAAFNSIEDKHEFRSLFALLEALNDDLQMYYL